MKEVKPSKKPLAIYYAIVLAVLLLLNLVLLPWMSERQVEEVDYGTFMTMTEEKNIGRVDIESNQIIFTDKEEKQVYKTLALDLPTPPNIMDPGPPPARSEEHTSRKRTSEWIQKQAPAGQAEPDFFWL